MLSKNIYEPNSLLGLWTMMNYAGLLSLWYVIGKEPSITYDLQSPVERISRWLAVLKTWFDLGRGSADACTLWTEFFSPIFYSLVHMIPRWPSGGSQLRSINMSGPYLTFLISERICLFIALMLCFAVCWDGGATVMRVSFYLFHQLVKWLCFWRASF